ncbi:hypothetical protein Tco_0877169 [Tanacetum coccineum]|uniref:Uncharacterized protein n=1 Tax=Tanacetum coccineum TaxID=301880 RepID=A0ABQ5BXJ8_9ASTR
MKSYGDQINEEVVVSKVFRSLSSKFNHVVAAIEEAHEQTEEKAFQVKGDSSSKGIVESFDFSENNKGGYCGHRRSRGRGGGGSKSDERQNRNPIQWRNGNKYGHKDVDC